MVSFPMPFPAVPCSIWLASKGTKDSYGNQGRTYAQKADIETRCLYAPGYHSPDTRDEFEDGRPYGTETTMTFYLPKTVTADLRGAVIAAYPADDATVSGRKWKVVGEPASYMRQATPGDYSWCVTGVRVDG